MEEINLKKPADLGRVFPTGVRVGETSYGMGVFSYALIPKGTPIGRVRGVIVHDPDYSSDYCIAAGDGMALEPAPPFCYLNHSCDPNCSLMHYVSEDELDGTEVEGNMIKEIETPYSQSVTKDDLYGDGDENLIDEMTLTNDDADDDCIFGDGGAEDRNEFDDDFDDEFDDENEDDSDNETDNETDTDDEQDELQEVIDDAADENESLFTDEENNIEIWVESLRDILPGEELTIDYAWPGDKKIKCLCGSPNCRGWITDPAEL